MPKWACKKDENHRRMSAAFVMYGWNVIDTSAFSGKMLDLFVYRDNGFFRFVEIKNNAKYKLTESEKVFFLLHQNKALVIWDVEQVRKLTEIAVR